MATISRPHATQYVLGKSAWQRSSAKGQELKQEHNRFRSLEDLLTQRETGTQCSQEAFLSREGPRDEQDPMLSGLTLRGPKLMPRPTSGDTAGSFYNLKD